MTMRIYLSIYRSGTDIPKDGKSLEREREKVGVAPLSGALRGRTHPPSLSISRIKWSTEASTMLNLCSLTDPLLLLIIIIYHSRMPSSTNRVGSKGSREYQGLDPIIHTRTASSSVSLKEYDLPKEQRKGKEKMIIPSVGPEYCFRQRVKRQKK